MQESQQQTPPISVHALAPYRGIKEIIESPLTIDAYISREEDGYRIYVNAEQPFTRRRFSIAHEIAHTFSYEVEASEEGLPQSSQRTLRIDSEEELLCNKAAAEILMPYKFFRAQVNQRYMRANSICELAKLFQVSTQAAAIRYCELTDRRFLLLAFKAREHQEQGKVLALDWWSKPDSVRVIPLKSLIINHPSPLFQCLEDGTPFAGRQPLVLGGKQGEYFVDALRTGEGLGTRVIALVVLERNPEDAIRTSVVSGPQVPLPCRSLNGFASHSA